MIKFLLLTLFFYEGQARRYLRSNQTKMASFHTPRNHPFILRYEKDSPQVLTMCACTRCGASSLYQSLMDAMDVHQVFEEGPYMSWAPFSLEEPLVNHTHFWIVRDPIERYISTYLFMVQCNAKGLPNFRTPNNRLGLSFLSPLGVSCLSFDEFVSLLERLEENAPIQRNAYIRPQHLHCPIPSTSQDVRIMNITAFWPAFNELGIPTLRPLRPLHLQSQDGKPLTASPRVLHRLCRLTQSEYEEVHLPQPPFCTEAHSTR